MAYAPQDDPNWNVKNKVWRIFTDQHGRKWGAQFDKQANGPCGPWEPQGWTAPWYLPQNASRNPYYRMGTEEDSRALILGYDTRLDDLRNAHKEWEDRKLEIALKHFPGIDIMHPPPPLLAAVGAKPLPLEPVLAAKKGDPWILGLSPVMPKWAEPFFVPKAGDEYAFMRDAEQRVLEGADASPRPDEKWAEFHARKRQEGWELAEIQRAWHDRSRMMAQA